MKKIDKRNVVTKTLTIILMLFACPGLVGTMQAAYWLCWGYTNVNNTRTNGVVVTAISRVNPSVIVNTTSYHHQTYGDGYFLASSNNQLPTGEYDVHFSYEPHLRNKVINYQSGTVNMGDVYLVRAELWSDDTIVILRNYQLEAIFCKYTGVMRELTVNGHGGLLSVDEPGQVIFKDTLGSEYSQYSDGNVTQIDSTMTDPKWVKAVFHLNFPYHNALITMTVDTLTLRWDNDFWLKSGTDRATRLDFSLPMLNAWHYAFWTSQDSSQYQITSQFNKTITYRSDDHDWVVLPAVILYDTILDYGVSFVCPFDSIKKPSLSFRMDASSNNFCISYNYLRTGISTSKHAYSSLYFVSHAGDWRPGLAWMLYKYPSFFNPYPNSPILADEGWYAQNWMTNDTIRMKNCMQRGVTWNQFHGFFPFYGLYAPAHKSTWSIIPNQDTISLSRWEAGLIPGQMVGSYVLDSILIANWAKYNISSYIYFQSFEAWHQLASRDYGYCVARKVNGDSIPGWKYCFLLNPDPTLYSSGYPWSHHVRKGLDTLLTKHPQVRGIMHDRLDYCNYDYAHNDGITMLNQTPVYMLSFALEKMNDTVCSFLHNYNPIKGIWGNGPTSIEVCKGIDGIMSEALWQAPTLQYLGLIKPMILLIYDRDPISTEDKLKYALFTGHFPNSFWPTNDSIACLKLDQKYRPLFALYKGRIMVLNSHALYLSKGIQGNIYKIPNNDYVIPSVQLEKYQILSDPFDYNRDTIKVLITGLSIYDHCYLLSGDYRGPRWLSFTPGSSVTITVPEHMVSSLVQLSTDPRYEYSEISSPVIRRGTNDTFQLRVQNISDIGGKNYNLILDTPFGDDAFQFYLGEEGVSNLNYIYTIPVNCPLMETTFYVIETNANPDDTTLFTVWVMDDVSLQLPQKLFIKFPTVDTFPLTIVNNTVNPMNVTLSGTFTTGHGTTTIIGANPVSLQGHERKDLKIQVALKDLTGTLQLVGVVSGNDTVGSIVRSVEHAMRPSLGDLFFDDFNRGYMNSQWNFWGHGDAWTPVDNCARGNGSHGWHFATVAAGNQNWTNYRFQMNTKMSGSTLPSISWLKSYMFFHVKNDTMLYRFGFQGDDDILSLYRRDGSNKWSRLERYNFVPQKDMWYNLAVEVSANDSIKCFLNGDLIIAVKDTTYRYGGIGIGVLEDSMTVYYDDIVVRPLTLPLTLFLDNFNSSIADTLWFRRQGTWVVMDSALQKFWRGYGSAHFATVMEDCDWSKCQFEVKTRMRGSTNPLISWLKSYIFFRVQNDSNYYRFGIQGNDPNPQTYHITLYKRVNGAWSRLKDYTPSTSPGKNIWYALKVEADSNVIKGYYNGSVVITYTDTSNYFQNGGIGIGVLEDYMKNDYDDVKILSYIGPPPP